ncbi:MAG: hypothetical protein MJB14_18340 [Spirochaetes bacterium]|nr:hypothetical protein [Spirochaetota bacterium]
MNLKYIDKYVIYIVPLFFIFMFNSQVIYDKPFFWFPLFLVILVICAVKLFFQFHLSEQLLLYLMLLPLILIYVKFLYFHSLVDTLWILLNLTLVITLLIFIMGITSYFVTGIVNFLLSLILIGGITYFYFINREHKIIYLFITLNLLTITTYFVVKQVKTNE